MASIRIDEPCSENFAAMPKTDMGAFCGRCRFEVIDFTAMTSDEIRAVLQARQDQRVCGHIGKDQLDDLHLDFMDWKQGQLAFRKTLLMALLVVFGMTLFSCSSADDKQIVQAWRKETMAWVGKSISRTMSQTVLDSDDILTVTGEVCVKPDPNAVNGGLAFDPEYRNYLQEE